MTHFSKKRLIWNQIFALNKYLYQESYFFWWNLRCLVQIQQNLEHKLILDRGICTYEIKLETAPHYHSDRFAVPMSWSVIIQIYARNHQQWLPITPFLLKSHLVMNIWTKNMI